MNWRKVLIGVLGVAFAIECLWPIGGFLAPARLLEAFKLGASPDTLFLTFVLSWCLLFVAIVSGVALRLVVANDAQGWTLSFVLGFWWIGIGTGLFFFYGKIENLFLDALKGAILVVAAWNSRARVTPS